MRTSTIQRYTKETKIDISLNLDGSGQSNIDTKVGFFNHMLTLFSFHSDIDLDLKCDGDIEVDSHHTIEDCGIALGLALKEALGNKLGINRYGHFTIPMDEALVTTDLDISNRAYLVFNVDLPYGTLGNYDVEMTEEFFRAVSSTLGLTLHINEAYGKNTHHIIEACFKSFGRAMKQAIQIDESKKDKVISSKGVL